MADDPGNAADEHAAMPNTRRRTVLVTGGTSGIGAATAEALARQQWTVVVVGRDPTRCESTVMRIRQATGNNAVNYLLGDLSSQDGVRSVAREYRARYDALHVLVNNVGGLFLNRRESGDGIELTLALNHLAPFLLTNLLLDVMCRSQPARIINVSSIGHHSSPGIRRDDLQWRRGFYRGFQVYHQSKLANLLFTYELARRLEGMQVEGMQLTVNAVGPGLVATNIGMDNRWYWRMLKPAVDRIFKSRFVPPDQAARTVVYLATSAHVDQVTASYFSDETAVPSSAASRDVEAAHWLWRESEKLTGWTDGQTASKPSAERAADRPVPKDVEPLLRVER